MTTINIWGCFLRKAKWVSCVLNYRAILWKVFWLMLCFSKAKGIYIPQAVKIMDRDGKFFRGDFVFYFPSVDAWDLTS